MSARPLSPRLSVYRWQPAMLASIAHRASGVVLLLFIPAYLWILSAFTGTPDEFAHMQTCLHSFAGRFVLWMVGSSLIYHFVNGIRFLCLDAGWGESRDMMRASARVVVGVGIAAILLLGALLW